MSRRAATLVIAGLGVAVSLAVAWMVAVPYVVLVPGPTYNTLGSLSGKPIIQITGRHTFPAPGHLNMVTVSYYGGPGYRPPLTIIDAIQAMFRQHEAVVPQWELFPPGQSQQQVIQQDSEQMANSEQTATAAALCQLGIKFSVIDTITGTVRGLPAAGMLHPGDVIRAVDGKAVTCRSSAASMIRARAPGRRVVLSIVRAGHAMTIGLNTASAGGQPIIGVNVVESFSFPFHVVIRVGKIGGPSAGMMFALGIIDKLTQLNLTGGRFIAGTGEIEVGGAVLPIGGIQQKMAAARAAGATVFLTPAANCPDTVGAVPPGLRLVKVSTLSGAIAALQALKQGAPVPSC
jgi:PDZ domain-containing protein